MKNLNVTFDRHLFCGVWNGAAFGVLVCRAFGWMG